MAAQEAEDNPRDRVISLLKELFQFDLADLDFGIYRIMNFKRKEIERFIEKDLVGKVEEELSALVRQSMERQQLELANLAAEANRTLGEGTIDKDGEVHGFEGAAIVREYVEKRKGLSKKEGDREDAVAIYNHIFEFFSRYYDQGDFLSKRRIGGREKYVVPYNGEEVFLHWANRDQHYAKTGEYFSNYDFKVGKWGVRFVLARAEVSHDNIKGNTRYFILSADKPPEVDSKAHELRVFFNYRGLTESEAKNFSKKVAQDDLTAGAIGPILEQVDGSELASSLKTKKDDDKTLLETHLNRYVKKNTTDYFIHKDLGGFLRRELEYYIQGEVLRTRDLTDAGPATIQKALKRAKTFQVISETIIDFLGQIEDFQRLLFEKKKLVLRTDYLVPIRKVPRGLWSQILACKEQVAEWSDLYSLEPKKDLLNPKGELNEHVLDKYPNLAIDTQHFDPMFKGALLESFDNIDEACGGTLIHAENFQALSLLNARYRERIGCIYIDPPYNTNSSAIPYKNDYKHSTYATMIEGRLARAEPLLTKEGVTFLSIDKTERTYVEHALDFVFGRSNRIEELIWVMNTTNSQVPNYSTNHEYVEVYAKDRPAVEKAPEMFQEVKPGFTEVMDLTEKMSSSYPTLSKVEEALERLYKGHAEAYKQEVESQGLDWEEEKRNDPWKGLYPYSHAEYRDQDRKLVPENEAKKRKARVWVWRESDMSMPATKQSPTTKDPKDPNYRFYRPLHPITRKPCPYPKRGWNCGKEAFDRLVADNRISWGENEEKVPRFKRFLQDVSQNIGKSVIVDYADGEKQTAALFGRAGIFMAPKPTSFVGRLVGHTGRKDETVLDFFGGSGSTAHAVIELNREDGGSRRFILVEVADYFDTVIVPRMKKVLFAPEWREGKPVREPTEAEVDRSPKLIKVLKLESYEDTLNNIVFKDRDKTVQETLDSLEGYFIRYMLDYETRGSKTRFSVKDFEDPFAYKIRSDGRGDAETMPVDLVETFNLLLGLSVERVRFARSGKRSYSCVIGRAPDGGRTVIVWRSTKDIDYVADRDFIQDSFLKELKGAFSFYANGLCHVKGAKSIEPVFKELMGG